MAGKTAADIQVLPDDRKQEFVTRFRTFLEKKYQKALAKAAEQNRALEVDFSVLDKFSPEMGDMLLQEPEKIFEAAEEAANQIYADLKIRVRFFNLPELTNIRDLRSKHIGKFVSVEGTVRRASEIRPEIMATFWECLDCGDIIRQPRKGAFVSRPWQCSCGKKEFKQIESEKIDTRWLTIEEPFELTEGDRPSQVTIFLSEDLVSPEGRRNSDPGNRLRITGILREVPKGKPYSVKLDFYLDANHVQPTEVGWSRLELSKEDEEQIKRLASQDNIYEMFVDSLAPSLYGLREIKESIIMQLFGGVPRTLKDGVHFRGDIHILLIGDPACLVGDERIFLGDGTTTKIQNLGTHHMQNIRMPVRIKGHISDMATTFHVYSSQPIIEIITESGKSLKGSYNQPVLVVEGVERKWKRLDELKAGERIAVIPSIQCRKVSPVPTGWRKADRRFGPRFRGRIPDKWDARLGALIGYLLGDGYVRENKGEIVAIVNKDEYDLVKILTGYIKGMFEMEPVVEARKVPDHEYHGRTIRSRNELYQIILRSKDVAGNLRFLKVKRVPDPVFLSPDSVVKEFLKWLFQADGTVFCKGRGRRAIQLKQKEIELLRDVQVLLLRFGIHSRIYENNLTIRRGHDIIKFAKHIGFASRNKKDKLLELSAEARDVKRVRRQLSEKIVRISRLEGAHTVYDIEVPKSKRFIANGIVVHNSGKSQLLKLVPEIVPRGRYVSGKGVTSAGLCMSYDTLVQSAHGEIRKIGKIVEEALKKGSERIESGFVGEKGDFEVVTLDSRTLKMKKMRASRFFKLRPTGKLVNIRTRTGREIKLTQENPVMVIRNGEATWKQAREIEPGDHIGIARFLPVNELPASTEPELARFLGMVAGDGNIGKREIRFHNGSENYLDGFSGICRNLGYKPRKYYQKNRVACVRVASKDLCDKVESLGMPRGRKADRIAIPREILLSNKLVSEFLSGIFDCDGCVVSKGTGSYI
jgi:DNA replicative helicase MCM subunit Mcm2 (Cdc46/Mcm family)